MSDEELTEKLAKVVYGMTEGAIYHWREDTVGAVREAMAKLAESRADLAAARAEVERLREAMRYAMDLWEDKEDPHYILAGIKDALAAQS
jgi:hypothetical protein